MHLVEQHVISKRDPRFAVIDAAAFASKNLYNATIYIVRQIFIPEGEYLNYNTMDKIMQKHEAYRGLPTKVAQEVVKQVHEAWISYFEACKEYREHPEKFTGRPKLPNYKDKASGRHLLTYNMQVVSRGKKTLDRGIIKPSQLGIEVQIRSQSDQRSTHSPKEGVLRGRNSIHQRGKARAAEPCIYSWNRFGSEQSGSANLKQTCLPSNSS